MNVDYIALLLSTPADIAQARQLIEAQDAHCGIIAKIERADAKPHLPAIIAAADGVMVARGDLALEVGAEQVPIWQKHIIKLANHAATPVIVATQMMESMITHTMPTRAEVSDVAYAVHDGVDAVMLSGETATGNHPALVIETMAKICATRNNTL